MEDDLQADLDVSGMPQVDLDSTGAVLPEGDRRSIPQIDTEVPEVAEGGPETIEPALPAPETAQRPPAGDPRAGLALLARSRTLELLAALGAEEAPVRYRTLAARLGTTMLATRLRELTAAGLVVRHVDTGPPIEVSYTLGPTAAPLTGPVHELVAWAATHGPTGQLPPPPAPPGRPSTETGQQPSSFVVADEDEHEDDRE